MQISPSPRPLLSGDKFQHCDIEILLENDRLTLRNAFLERTLDLSQGLVKTVRLTDLRTGFEYADEGAESFDFSFPGYNLPTTGAKTQYALQSVEVICSPAGYLEGEHVRVRLVIREEVQKLQWIRDYFLYPGIPVISARCGISSETAPNCYWSRRKGLWNDERWSVARHDSVVDGFKLKSVPVSATAVELVGRTDYTNDQVIEETFSADEFSASGNLLFLRNSATAGLFVLQEAPPSSERRDGEEYDFRLTSGALRSVGWGVAPHEISDDQPLYSYRTTIGLFSGDEKAEGRLLLKRYLATRFPQDLKKDFDVLVNPWGCGTFNKEVNEEFLLREIRAAAEVGATHYQIDDGWQQGRSLAELIVNNRSIDSGFWEISSETLPNGFGKLQEEAKKSGVELAIWIAPSSNKEFRDWEDFVEVMYGFYSRYGIRRFKIDGVSIRTKLAEDRLEQMLRTLRLKSNGEIMFNFDVTNGQRAGYYLFLEYGNVFLQNRYACHDWGMVYHPEIALRNLWRLSQYVRPQTLQIEFTDPLNLNRGYYDKLGVSYPDLYSPGYWAAVTLFAAPLIWLAPSKLPAELKQVFKEVMLLHRKFREEIFAGEIFPVGDEPSGGSLTGFQSYRADEGRGFLIVYREKNAPAVGAIRLLFCQGREVTLSSLSDDAAPIGIPSGADPLEITLDAPGSFRLYRYTTTE